jgi:cholest-4-en-3-one 26-monooxygenase
VAPDGRDYWAVTRHADIVEISRQPRRFESGKPLNMELGRDGRQVQLPPTVLDMNPPVHGIYRQIISRRFTPRGLRRVYRDVEDLALEVLDEVTTGDAFAEIDFVQRLSAPIPIAVIGWMLGVPRPDWPRLFDWTNQTAGAGDPEYQQGRSQQETTEAARIEIFEYFDALARRRREQPEDDLVSALVHADLDGSAMSVPEMLMYSLVLVAGGNETTRNATSGGMLAFIENPDQWRSLCDDLDLLRPAVEEVLRWTTPVIHFTRRATENCELGGQKIREGDIVALFYPSANRDEAVFEDPYSFRIDRVPNRHLAFGVGEHFCLGAHVARLELEVIYRHLAPRLEHIELVGPVERLRSATLGGIKHMPVRYGRPRSSVGSSSHRHIRSRT